MNKFKILFINDVRNFINSLSDEDKVKINCDINAMELGNFNSLYIKRLSSPVKELIIKKYRLIFFINKNEIENAKKLYKEIINL